VLTGCAEDTVSWKEQQGETSYAHKLERHDRELDPTETSRVCHDRVRALSPDIGCDAWTAGGLELKIWRSWAWNGAPQVTGFPQTGDLPAGEVVATQGRLFVACSDGWLELFSVQPSGKKMMSAAEFLRGYERRLGGRLLPPSQRGRESDDLSEGPATGPRQEN
jgi:methionyl-tRNA formyltransferase